jgi:glycosyltransferase involved in cell wall biosynthesis
VPNFLVFAALVPKFTGAKIILDMHDLVPELYASKFSGDRISLTYRILLITERLSARFADHVIAANHLWERKLLGRSVPADKCTTLLNYPDTSIFQRRGRTRNNEEFIILYPGTLNWHQGLDVAIRAFARVHEQFPHARFDIYGGGPATNDLIALAQQLGLGDKIRFKGFLPLREIVRVMEDADLAVVPKRGGISFGNQAFSTKTLEFMVLGVPLIVADTEIDRYYFDDSVVTFFRCEDEEDLASCLRLLIASQQVRTRQASNALAFASRYEWSANEYRYLEILESLIPRYAASLRHTQVSGAEHETVGCAAAASRAGEQ